MTLHWRHAPEAGSVGARPSPLAGAASGDCGSIPGRLSLELRPPLDVDKGTVVRSLVAGMQAVAVFGDDLGDLPAFAAAAELAAQGVAVVRVAVIDEESAAEVAAQADLVVEGPAGALALLEQLARPRGDVSG